MWAFCFLENQSFSPICPKTLCSLNHTPIMLRIKIDQDWPTGFRVIQVQKCEIFVTQGQVTLKWMVWFGPKSNTTELLWLSWIPATLMMIRSKMNGLAWKHHFPIISLFYGKLYRRWRAANSVVSGPISYQRYSSSKVWNFRHSKTSNPKRSVVWSGPKSNSS